MLIFVISKGTGALKMPKIKNKLYKEFIENQEIQLVQDHHIMKALDRIEGKFKRQGRSLLIMMYYSGARPCEIFLLKGKDVEKSENGRHIVIHFKTKKKGIPRTLLFPMSKPMVKELWKYCSSLPLEMTLFYKFKSNSIRTRKNKMGRTIKDIDYSNNLRYYFKIWFEGIFEEPIPPYYLRHSRFSKFADKGAEIGDIRIWKGGKSNDCVYPYIHLLRSKSKKMSRML